MAFPSAPSALRHVGLLTVLFAAAVPSNIVYGKLLCPSPASHSLDLAVSPWGPDLPDPVFLSPTVPLIC